MLSTPPIVSALSGGADLWYAPSLVRAYTVDSVRRLLMDGGFEVADLVFDRDTAFRVRKDPLHFPLDLVRWGLGFVCFGSAGRFSEVFAVGRKVRPRRA